MSLSKDAILDKMDEVISRIMSKDANNITYAEYRILEARYLNLKYEEDQKKRNQEFAEMTAKVFANGVCSTPVIPPLPEPAEE